MEKIRTIGLVFADDMEYAPYLQWAKENGGKEGTIRKCNCVETVIGTDERKLRLVAVECGIGKVNAAAATAFLIEKEKADYIFNAGLSGAVYGLKREDMVALTSCVECDFDLTAIGYGLGVKPDGQKYIYDNDEKLISYALMSPGIIKAKSGTGDIFLTDPVKKELYRNTFSIDCFDMETAAIAAVCYKCDVPMLSLRKISDDADGNSVDDYREMNLRKEACLTELLCNIFTRMLQDDEMWK